MNAIRWITYLSIDAPLVVIVWQEFIARESAFAIGWHHRLIIGLSVWLGYVADRWFDAWRYQETESKRHRLHRKYRWPILGLWCMVLGVAIGLSLHSLSAAELYSGLALMAFSILVTGLIQKRFFGSEPHQAKAALTAILIASSSTLFALSNESDKWGHLAVLVAALFGLFTVNCLLIHHWDIPVDRSHGESISLKFEPLRLRLLAIWLLSSVIALFAWAQFQSYLGLPLTLSFLGLLYLAIIKRRVDLDTRRTLADVSLLTPLFFIWS